MIIVNPKIGDNVKKKKDYLVYYDSLIAPMKKRNTD